MRESYTASVFMSFDEEKELLRIKVNDNVTLELPEMKRYFELCSNLTNGKPCKLLVEKWEGVKLTKEAKKYSVTFSEKRKATAIISKDWRVKITLFFYILFYNPKSPIKIFSSEEKALFWLNTY